MASEKISAMTAVTTPQDTDVFPTVQGGANKKETRAQIVSGVKSTIDGHISNSDNPHATTYTQVGADAAGTAASAVSNHVGEEDPHSQYAIQASTSTDRAFARFYGEDARQLQDSQTVEDSQGNVLVRGKVIVYDSMIMLNNGETGAGVTNLRAGLDIDRGTLFPYRVQMHETTDDLRIGQYYVSLPYTGLTGTFQASEKVTGGTSGAIGWIITDNGSTMTLRGTATAFTNGETITGETSLATATAGTQVITDATQAVATRQDVPTSAGVVYWNSGESRFDTMTGITSTDTVMTVGATGTLDVSGGTITFADQQIPASKVVTTEQWVNEAPATETSTGVKGQMFFDPLDCYLYFCVATDTWVRGTVETNW